MTPPGGWIACSGELLRGAPECAKTLHVEARRHWTVEEANAALAFVGPRIDALRAILERLSAPQAAEGFARAAAESGGGWPGRQPARDAVALSEGLRALGDLGIVIRDLERGLIDFPAMIDGQEVYLCWLREEPRVSYYHLPDAGFAGRRPLS
jgi:hypothetical protein